MVHALHRAERQTCGRVGNSCCETVDSNLHCRHFSGTTFNSIDWRTTSLSYRLAYALWIDSGPQTLGALPNLLQCRFKSSQLFRTRIGKDFPNFGCVFAKNRADQFFAFWGERYDPDAPILRTLDPAYQASIQQAIDGNTNRAGRKVHLWADRIHRQRPFVEERFKYPEVGIVDSRLLKSRIKIFRGRPKRLHQYQPTVNRVSRVLVHDGTIVPFLYNRCPEECIYINMMDINRLQRTPTRQHCNRKRTEIDISRCRPT